MYSMLLGDYILKCILFYTFGVKWYIVTKYYSNKIRLRHQWVAPIKPAVDRRLTTVGQGRNSSEANYGQRYPQSEYEASKDR